MLVLFTGCMYTAFLILVLPTLPRLTFKDKNGVQSIPFLLKMSYLAFYVAGMSLMILVLDYRKLIKANQYLPTYLYEILNVGFWLSYPFSIISMAIEFFTHWEAKVDRWLMSNEKYSLCRSFWLRWSELLC